jgi:glycosyltransferase involved in cell wall biosynthesis
MIIAYLSVDNPKDYKSWSGLKLNIYNTLKSLKHNIKIIGSLKNFNRLPFIVCRELFKIFGLKYDSDRKFYLSKAYSLKISKLLKKIDLIFTSDTYLVSLLDTNIPIVLWLDVTFKTYYNHYFNKKKFHKKSFDEANKLEKLALDKATKIILTSEWAKKETIKNYKINPKKIHVLPFGSNLKNSTKINLENINNNIKLLSIGVDWNRKGMEKSIRITKELNKMGLKTTLNIVGCKNKKQYPDYVNQVGFLNKNLKSDIIKLKELLLESDLHILMTKKEACGVVFAEANSFGLFNITNNVGGVKGMIKNNFNGKLFHIKSKSKKIAFYIKKIFQNKKKFLQLKKQSLKYYHEKLSWKSNSLNLQKILIEAVNSKK